MRKHTKFIILLGIILSILLGSILYMKQSKNCNDNSKNSGNINKLVKDIQEYEIENFDINKIYAVKDEVDEVLEQSQDKADLSKANFVLGYLDAYEKNYEDAIQRFKKSISYFKNVKDVDMKARVYYELSRVYLYNKEYKKSNEVFKEMKEICEKSNHKEHIVKYSMRRSYDIYIMPDGENKSVKILEGVLDLAKKIDYEDIEDIYFLLGRAYWSEDRIIEGINAKLEALSIARAKNKEEKIYKISTDIGIDYLYSGNYNEAIIYLSQVMSYNLDDKEEDAKVKSYSLLNLCEAYIKSGDYDSAIEAFDKLELKIDEQKDGVYKEDSLTHFYANKADLEIELGRPLNGLKLLDLASSRYEKRDYFNFYDFDVKLLEEYGDAYYKIGDYEKSLKYHKEAEKLGKKRELSYLEKDFNNKIYLDYKAIGDNENIIKYLEKNNELKSKLFIDKDRQYSHYLVSKFESEKKAEEISKLKEYKNTMGLIFVILCGVTMIILTFTITIYKKNKEINRLNKLFKKLSITDSLTKVQNRRALDEYLAGNWALYKETQMPISFMMIDIDFFKKYNDNYGHPEGDKVLVRVATTIKKSCRNSDFVARYGGEEFIVIMLNTDENEGINLVKRIIKNIHNNNIEHKYSEVSDRISLSIGLTTAYIRTHNDYNDYIKKADNALYEAKQSGRNRYVYLP